MGPSIVTKTSNLVLNASIALLGLGLLQGCCTSSAKKAAAQYRPPKSSLVAWWQGDGNAIDSASGHNGTLQNGVAFEPGKFGQAFSFVPGNSRVFVPDSDAFRLTDSLSIAAWVNIRGSCWLILVRGDNRPGLDPYSLGLDASGRLQFAVESQTKLATVSAPIEFNRWKHVAGTLDGATGEMRLYIDGQLAAKQVTSLRPFADLDPAESPGVIIGNAPGAVFPFWGLIDELVLYSRALSPSEIQALAR